jgi:hypothetical protein
MPTAATTQTATVRTLWSPLFQRAQGVGRLAFRRGDALVNATQLSKTFNASRVCPRGDCRSLAADRACTDRRDALRQ